MIILWLRFPGGLKAPPAVPEAKQPMTRMLRSHRPNERPVEVFAQFPSQAAGGGENARWSAGGGVRPEDLDRLAEVQPGVDRQVRTGFDRLADEPRQVFRQRG